MGTVVMPKNSADLEVLIPILKYYYNLNDWVDNAKYIAYIKKYLLDTGIDDKERESQHYTKRMQVLSYFGFIEWEDLSNSQTKRRITNLGKKFYEAVQDSNQEFINEIIVESLEKTIFGRKNFGVPSSDSDVDAPILCIRAILDLDYITKIEFAYLLFSVQDNGFTYTTIINEIKDVRLGILKEIKLPEDANKYTDWKPVNFLERFHFLETENSKTRINDEVLKLYKTRLRNLKIYNIDRNVDDKNITLHAPLSSKIEPTQTIYYGVPGSGKSHRIDVDTKDYTDAQKIRVVFHPEYTNADFIGQILPRSEEDGDKISYPFVAGPFTQLLARAYTHKNQNFALIIEEINRGNAAAIFGELFQLLDRLDKDEEGSSNEYNYTAGWSSYPVSNDNINKFIHEAYESEATSEGFAPFIPKENFEKYKENIGIRLPPNLSLYATMNTSDQNVFTLDNAFQRRWDMKLIENECDVEEQMGATITVKDQTITWRDFQKQINNIISEKSNESGLSSMEDKRLGCWFVKAKNYEIPKDTFTNKVLKYLWDDAFKFYHAEVFKEGIKNFEELLKEFNEIGFDVFSDTCGLKEYRTFITLPKDSNNIGTESIKEENNSTEESSESTEE